MLVHSPRARSRSPLAASPTANESQQRTRSLKSFVQTFISTSASIGSTYDEQARCIEQACLEQYPDLSPDRIRRVIRSALKLRKSHSLSAVPPFRHQSDLISPPVPALSVLDGDFLRHVFSQQYRPSVDLSTYFSPSTPTPPLYRPNFSPFTHTNELDPMSPSSKPLKLSHAEANSIRVLVNAYREAASYLSRSADELEQLT